MRTVGDDFEPRQFSTYSACAIALIGPLPGTLADRSVSIELQRRLAGEAIEPFRFDRTEHLDLLARKAARWAADNADRVSAADPVVPPGIFNRIADNWRPLLAIADIAGGEWPQRARRALEAIHATVEDDSIRVQLLADTRAIFSDRGLDRVASDKSNTSDDALLQAAHCLQHGRSREAASQKPAMASGLAARSSARCLRPALLQSARTHENFRRRRS